MTPKRIIIVTGPTASGKSALAVDLAGRLGTDVISADSRQVYRDIPIATAVPTEDERDGIPHHFLETLPLDAYFSAAMFAEQAQPVVRELLERTGSAIVAGGSMMYIDALFGAIDEMPTVPDGIRQSVVEMHHLKGDDWLRMRVAELDPATAVRLDPANIKRWLHALEICLTAGRSYSEFLNQKKERPFGDAEVIRIVLEGEREELFDRINSRAEMMLRNGLLDEARNVLPLRHLNSLNTVGLKEMFAYLDGEMTLPEALARMQKNTRVFAKKQMTWLKRPPLGADYADLTIRLPYGSDSSSDSISFLFSSRP